MEEEHWSDWIEHNGKGCPYPVGTVIHAEYLSGWEHLMTPEVTIFTLTRAGGGASWWYKSLNKKDWSLIRGGIKPAIPIIRYRVKKPKGLTMLEGILNKVGQGNCVPRLLEKM